MPKPPFMKEPMYSGLDLTIVSTRPGYTFCRMPSTNSFCSYCGTPWEPE
jgi:hypothetical protein